MRIISRKQATIGIVGGKYNASVRSVVWTPTDNGGYFAVYFDVHNVDGKTYAKTYRQNVFPTWTRRVEVGRDAYDEPIYEYVEVPNLLGELLELAQSVNSNIPDDIDDDPKKVAQMLTTFLQDVEYKITLVESLSEQGEKTPYYEAIIKGLGKWK